jgi:hypothetical protein
VVYRYIGKVATELILVGLGYPLRSYPRNMGLSMPRSNHKRLKPHRGLTSFDYTARGLLQPLRL